MSSGSNGSSLGKNNHFLCLSHLQYLSWFSKRILGFDNSRYLTPMLLPYEGLLSFGRQIWLELSSDSSLGSSTPCFPLLWGLDLLSSDTLVFAYIFPPFRVMI